MEQCRADLVRKLDRAQYSRDRRIQRHLRTLLCQLLVYPGEYEAAGFLSDLDDSRLRVVIQSSRATHINIFGMLQRCRKPDDLEALNFTTIKELPRFIQFALMYFYTWWHARHDFSESNLRWHLHRIKGHTPNMCHLEIAPTAMSGLHFLYHPYEWHVLWQHDGRHFWIRNAQRCDDPIALIAVLWRLRQAADTAAEAEADATTAGHRTPRARARGAPAPRATGPATRAPTPLPTDLGLSSM